MAIDGKKVVAVIEARMTSSRLPGKVLMTAGGKPMLQILCERLRKVSRIDEIVIATTVNATDDPVVALAASIGVSSFRGSEDDVLQRVDSCLVAHDAGVCVEVTGDCPLADPAIVDEALDAFEASPEAVYVSNSDPHRSVPAGLDVQVFFADALHELEREVKSAEDREHVTYGFYGPDADPKWNPKFVTHESTKGAEKIWVSLDNLEDFELIKALHEEVSESQPEYGAKEIIDWVNAHPEMHQKCLDLRPEWITE